MIDKLQKLAIAFEAEGRHDESFKITALVRELNAANSKDSDIEISSWADFLGWWNNNRGQALSYVFIDTYGDSSEEAHEVTKLIQESNALEEHLHSFYMKLRRKAQQQAVPGAAPAAGGEGGGGGGLDLSDLSK
jgi:hypothetical protein